jgi:hypothetical protein
MIKKTVEIIDTTLGMVAGAIAWTVIFVCEVVVLFSEGWREYFPNFISSSKALTFLLSGAILLGIIVFGLSGGTFEFIVCLLPMIILGGGAVAGLFYGIYEGFNKGLSGLITGADQSQEQSTLLSFQLSQSEENYSALVDRVRKLKVSSEAKQYIKAMITEENLAEFKSIIVDTGANPYDKELYGYLIAPCQIKKQDSLLKKADPPITVKRETDGGEVFFSTYSYAAFLEYLMNKSGEEHINDPVLHVPLDSEEITFFIGFPNVKKKDFDYIREQLRKKAASSLSVSTGRAELPGSSRRHSDDRAVFFHHPLAPGAEGANRRESFTFNARSGQM